MELMRTLKFKVRKPTKRKIHAMKRTIREYNNCVNFQLAELQNGQTQKELYNQSKTKWSNLNTGLIQTARDEAKGIIKQSNESKQSIQTVGSYHPIRFDKRTATIKERGGVGLRLGISLVSGKEWMPIVGGERNQEILESMEYEFQGILLQYKPHTDDFYVHIQIKEKRNIPDEFDIYIGVDMGIDNIAVCSAWNTDGEHLDSLFLDGNELLEKRNHYFRVRRSMQQNGVNPRHIKHKEQRYIEDQCHKLSRRIVDFADQFDGNVCIVLEKLDGIRKNMRSSKKANRKLHSWPFGKLNEYIQYKTHESEIAYRMVNPRGTSSYCTHCMSEVKVRDRFLVECLQCGRTFHRDHLASKNIVQRLWFYKNDNSGHRESGPEPATDEESPMFARTLNGTVEDSDVASEAHTL